MKSRIIITALLSSALLAGCQQPSQRDTGAVIGGIAGGVLGNQIGGGSGRTAAVIAGTLVGAYIGGSIGQQMDDNDHYRAQRALETSRTNYPTSWNNPDTGYEYTVTPTRTYETTTSGPCRDYTTEAVIDGRREIVHGTACRQSDGTWRASN
jgi:surface antigen